jgi:hypothetical protein
MIKQQVREIRQRLEELRRAHPIPANKREAPTLQYLRERLKSDLPKPLHRILLTILANECGYLGLVEEEESTLLQSIGLDPADPLPHIAFATFLKTQPHRLEDARNAAKLAIGYAETTGRFRRDALQTLARIAREREDYTELSSILESLASLHMEKDVADCAVENDFLVGLPEGAIDGGLLEKVRSRT